MAAHKFTCGKSGSLASDARFVMERLQSCCQQGPGLCIAGVMNLAACTYNAGAEVPLATCATAFPAVEHEGMLWLRPTPLPPGQPFNYSGFDPVKELHGARNPLSRIQTRDSLTSYQISTVRAL